jgi:hypothetical protein
LLNLCVSPGRDELANFGPAQIVHAKHQELRWLMAHVESWGKRVSKELDSQVAVFGTFLDGMKETGHLGFRIEGIDYGQAFGSSGIEKLS